MAKKLTSKTQQFPPDALYGIWDAEKAQWTGEWIYSDKEAVNTDLGLRRSGLHLTVIACRDGIDDSWLGEIELE